jgi:hypothetical protein
VFGRGSSPITSSKGFLSEAFIYAGFGRFSISKLRKIGAKNNTVSSEIRGRKK